MRGKAAGPHGRIASHRPHHMQPEAARSPTSLPITHRQTITHTLLQRTKHPIDLSRTSLDGSDAEGPPFSPFGSSSHMSLPSETAFARIARLLPTPSRACGKLPQGHPRASAVLAVARQRGGPLAPEAGSRRKVSAGAGTGTPENEPLRATAPGSSSGDSSCSSNCERRRRCWTRPGSCSVAAAVIAAAPMQRGSRSLALLCVRRARWRIERFR